LAFLSLKRGPFSMVGAQVMILANKQDYGDASTIGEVTDELNLVDAEQRFPNVKFSIQ